jgi:hypothetical protein
MSDHDPLCRQRHWEGGDCFDCRLIAKVRADERERMMRVGYIEPILLDLRAEIQAMHAEAGQALLHSVTRDEVTAASTGISVLEDVLRALDRSSDE